ncbi:sigma-70 family RNA polymerase sigma factor [Streptomyces luteoverticillatus]|uniref:sigma-70 family RNA polymerase sigma factor n=1 Tax=Streptomyces luteoverticillatus TaxID=66425 RepID=UPI0013E01AB2|nr:sigma-70 family RNA polymerase sigma factor [Streptomyces luteoverticillatus]
MRTTITAEQITAAQNGDAAAAEQILDALEGAAVKIAADRATRIAGGTQMRDDLMQEARLAFWRALQDWDVDADNAAAFTTYAFQRAKFDVHRAALRWTVPGIGDVARATFAAALRQSGGNFDEAVHIVTSLDDPERRLSPQLAALVRSAFEGPEPIEGSSATAAGVAALPASSSAYTSGDRWAEDQGQLPDHMCHPLDLSRDAVRCKGVATTGKGVQVGAKRRERIHAGQPPAQGRGATWREVGALADHAADREMRERSIAVGHVIAGRVAEVLSPAEREVVSVAYGTAYSYNEATAKGTPDLHTTAQVLGKTHNTVNVTLKRARTKLRKAREVGHI